MHPFMHPFIHPFTDDKGSPTLPWTLAQAQEKEAGKVLISGTGRAGTTFLILLFTFLGLDSGFTRENYSASIFQNCGSGMEKPISSPNRFLKNPTFVTDINQIFQQGIAVSSVIMPIRNYTQSAISRNKHQNNKGGLWGLATDVPSQEAYFHRILAEYLVSMVKYDIPTVFLDFERMVTDDMYLFHRLKFILPPTVSPGAFKQAFGDATISLSKPQLK